MKHPFASRALCAALFTAFVPAIAFAQPAPVASPTPIPEIAHVVTTDRSEESLKNVSRTTYVVTRAEMLRNGYRTVADALADVPGMQLFRYGAIGAGVNFGIRGSTSAQTLVLIDGLPAPGTSDGTVSLASYSTTGVERIEVVEGGGSALYGSGAVGGIINIITQSATSTPDARLLVGSFADRELSVEVPGFGIDRTVVANSYGLPPDSAIGPQWMDAACEATSGHAAFDRRIGAVAASLRATFTTDHLGVPGGTSFYSPGNREDDVNDAAQISLAHKAARAESTLQFGGSDQQVAFWSPSLAFTTDGGDDASFRNVVDQGRGTVVYGIDLSRNVVRGDDGFGDITTNPVSHAAAYAQQTFETSPGDRSYVAVRAERDGSEGGRVSPSAGFTHRIAAGVSLKANLANAFRAPNATELYFPGYGNPQLKSELSSVGDLTIDDANVLGGTSLGWFFNRSKNLIVYNPVTNAAANVDTAAIYGLTYEVRTRPYHRISASFDVTDLYQALDLTTGGRLPNDPVLTTNLELVYHGSETAAIESAGVTVKAAGDRGPTSPELPLYDQPIAFADTTAYVRFRLGQRALLSLRGYNLGNERYAQIHGYPVPGRSFTAEISTH